MASMCEATTGSASRRCRHRCSGEVDGSAAASADRAYARHARHPTWRPEQVVLDFTAVDYINSTGIALIVSVLAHARAEHRKVVASGLSEHYREIFDITRLSDFIELFPTSTAPSAS